MDTDTSKYRYRIVDHIDFVFEEQGDKFSALRKVAWGDASDEKAKLEVRRWINKSDGTILANKGLTFLTEEGPGELACALLKLGHANTKDVLISIKDRDDFRKSLNSVLGKDDEAYDESAGTLEDDYYDPREVLGV